LDGEEPLANIPIEKLNVTILFNEVADEVWFLVKTWGPFERDTIGKQLATSIDSVPANIIEGGHRDSDIDAVRHFVIARGSAGEAMNWLRRVAVRGIESEQRVADLLDRRDSGLKQLEGLIRFRRQRASKRKPTP